MTTIEHIDVLRDVFAEIAQDCLLLDLAPCHLDVSRYSEATVHVGVQFMGTDTVSVDALAESWGLGPDNGKTGNYTRAGRLDIDGHRVTASVYTGRPALPRYPAGYAPVPTVVIEIDDEDGPDPHVCGNPDCDHQRAFHHDGGCMGLSCSCAVFEEPAEVRS